MRFRSLRLRGIGPFVEEVHVDLEPLTGLVAVSGANGAGKSMALECLFGGAYRRMPTRGSLRDVATARDSFVEVGLTNGAPWTLRQRVDGTSGKGESEVLDALGAPVLSAAKLREGDAWVAAHLPDPDVVLASIFGAQGSQGFLDLDPTERKRVILRVLGHERLEGLSKAAGERARAAKAEHDTLVARLADERERGGDGEALTADLDHARAVLALAQQRAQEAAHALAAAREQAAEHERQMAAHKAAAGRLGELAARRRTLRAELDDLAKRRENNAELLEHAAEIRAAVDRVVELDGLIATATERMARAEAAAAGASEGARFAAREASSLRAQEREAEERLAVLERALVERDGVAALAATVEARRAELEDLIGRRSAAEIKLAELRELQLEGKERRIAGLRDGLGGIVGGLGPGPELAQEALAADDTMADEMASAPERIAAAQRELRDLTQESALAVRLLEEADDAVRALADLDTKAAVAEEMRQLLAAKTAEREAADARAADATERMRRAVEEVKAAGLELGRWQLERRAQERLAGRLPKLEAAEARIEELDGQAAKLTDEHDEVVAAIGDGELPPITVERPNLGALESADDLARKVVTDAELALQRADDAAKRAEESRARIEALEADRDRVEAALADWRLLERDLGRNGVQALELDAAGPELTELANDLLHSCLGTRFSVRIESTRRSADGKKDIEGCWVYVYDAQANREAEAKTFSGGERVLIGEAINLAIAMLGVRHAGLSTPTLVRDETGAALDSEKGRAYLAMLRRAAEIVGAPSILFVTHDTELQELADHRLVVAGGRIEVQ